MNNLTWENAADELTGCKVMVEIDHQDALGRHMRHDHVWGTIVLADRTHGVRIAIEGKTYNGKFMILPADLSSFTKPQLGSYTLHSTGEQITDPHWFTTWVVKDPKQVNAQINVKRPTK